MLISTIFVGDDGNRTTAIMMMMYDPSSSPKSVEGLPVNFSFGRVRRPQTHCLPPSFAFSFGFPSSPLFIRNFFGLISNFVFSFSRFRSWLLISCVRLLIVFKNRLNTLHPRSINRLLKLSLILLLQHQSWHKKCFLLCISGCCCRTCYLLCNTKGSLYHSILQHICVFVNGRNVENSNILYCSYQLEQCTILAHKSDTFRPPQRGGHLSSSI